MSMMTSQILKSVDFIKKKIYISKERKIMFFPNEKNLSITYQGYFTAKKSFLAEIPYKH